MSLIEEKGTVIELTEDTAKVLIPRSEACEGCRSCHESAGGLGMTCEVPRTGGLRMGDKVKLAGREASGTKGGLLLYILPLAFLFVGYLVGEAAAGAFGYASLGETVGVLTGFMSFVLPFLIVYRVYKRKKSSGNIPFRS